MHGEFFARIPLFAALSPEKREELSRQVHERRYQRGALIFAEGEPGEAAYFVHEGRVRVYRVSPDGREQILGVFGPGQPFGLVTALDRSPYPASAVATEETRVWMIPTEHLQRLLTFQPELSSEIMREVGSRLRRAQGRVQSMAAHSVQQRVALHLLELVEEQGSQVRDEGAQIRLTMTHQELGNYLGASRESVTRALADLRRDGAVKAGAGDALIVYPDRLQAWLEN